MQLNSLLGTLSPNSLEFIRRKIPVKYEKQRISSAALHRISCSRVGSLSSVALFRCIFSFGTFFGFIRVYTVVFSDPVNCLQRTVLPLVDLRQNFVGYTRNQTL